MVRIVLAAVLLAACAKDGGGGDRGAPDQRREPVKATPAVAAPPPAEEREPSYPADDAQTLEQALALSVPTMTDTTDELSDGAIAFARWAMMRMQWADVAVKKNETSHKLVQKDPDTARGKRLCLKGRLVSIRKEGEGLFAGLFAADGFEIARFIAVGSTGELVERSRARICGVATGRYTYANAGGGTTHAISVVGMFDLPENRGQ